MSDISDICNNRAKCDERDKVQYHNFVKFKVYAL